MYRVLGKKQSKEFVPKSFKTDNHYDSFVQGNRALYSISDDKNEKKKPVRLNSLDEVIAASKVAGSSFWLEDPVAEMLDDVSNLKGFRSNVAAGFEALSNRAIAINEELAKEYGSLKPLNDGRSVIFQYKSGNTFVECDGLIMNTTHVLLNEAKTRFHKDDIARFVGVTAVNLQVVQLAPEKFISVPEGIIGQLKGKQLVLVASGGDFTKEAEAACAEAGIHQLRQSGAGFVCTLAR